LIVTIGVGDPNSPNWSQIVWNRQGGATHNLNLTVDLSNEIQYLPPSSNNTWYLEVYDAAKGDQGQIVSFTVTYDGHTYTSTSVPVPIYDSQTSYAYIQG
jgi:subtilisin-like proprotein convertase family protein